MGTHIIKSNDDIIRNKVASRHRSRQAWMPAVAHLYERLFHKWHHQFKPIITVSLRNVNNLQSKM